MSLDFRTRPHHLFSVPFPGGWEEGKEYAVEELDGEAIGQSNVFSKGILVRGRRRGGRRRRRAASGSGSPL
jgi:hypothetical protein